ncbi:hypothetical protein TorRG33x02_277520 [Trema orientale]|uniref:Uncharacterized protein n=1 Tax=Trema orientale TaxID=63057 RepID=A0A2P5CPU2_TREOI|nr:hypothetical protein TorRG33x02_277520 [Trema orientale]
MEKYRPSRTWLCFWTTGGRKTNVLAWWVVGNRSHDQSVKVQEMGEMASNNLAKVAAFEKEESSKVWET